MTSTPVPTVDIPTIDIDPAAIRAAVRPLPPLNLDIQDHVRVLLTAWHAGAPYYQAPEAPALLDAIDPVGPVAVRAGLRLSGAARTLTTYADTVEPIIAELGRLRTAGPPATAQQAGDVTSQVRRLMEELAAAEADCVKGLKAQAGNPKFDPQPSKIAIGDETQKTDVGVKVGFIKAGANAAFVITRFSDGSELWTFTDARTLGATVGLGPRVEFGSSGLGAKVELAPGITLGVGDSWRIADAAQAKQMRNTVSLIIARQLMADDPDYAQALLEADVLQPAELPPPDLVTTDVKFEGTVTGKLGADDTGVLDANLSAAGGGSYKTASAFDNADGSTITTTTTDLTGTFGGRFDAGTNHPYGGVGTEATGTAIGGIALTRNADGLTSKVALTMTQEVADKSGAKLGGEAAKVGFDGATSHVTTTTVTLEVNDGNRALVDQAIAGMGPDLGGTVRSPGTYYPDRAVPGDAFQNLLHSDATVTRTEADKVTAKTGVDAQVAEGLTLGANANLEHSASGVVRSTYLGTPDADGVRHEIDIPNGVDTRPNPVLGRGDTPPARRGSGGTF